MSLCAPLLKQGETVKIGLYILKICGIMTGL